jgi:hypothetical protein
MLEEAAGTGKSNDERDRKGQAVITVMMLL